LVKSSEGRVDIVSELRPLDTLKVAQSPFATVVKTRGSLGSVFGRFNMLKVDSPWRDVRLRQAVNLAINREDLIRYATKGNGVIIPALLPEQAFGYNPDLVSYTFDPDQARALLQEAGYAEGLSVNLIASPDLEVQATVIGKMLEQVGLQVKQESLDPADYNRRAQLSHLEKPAEEQTWDIALIAWNFPANVPVLEPYHVQQFPLMTYDSYTTYVGGVS
jgi:ABC-type transport system substrate-binding protein